jgi:lipoprotein-anchoring transpeptidase ErfK/SrfK
MTVRVWPAPALLIWLAAAPVTAQPKPWVAPGDVPLPSWALSVEVLERDEPLYARPLPRAPRRGSAARNARLPLYGALRGHGCAGRWLLVGPVAWVCEDRVRLSRHSPLPAAAAAKLISDGLPYRYFYVGKYGSFGYANLSLAEDGVFDAQFDPGFAVAILQVKNKHPGDPFGLTTHGFWVPMRDLTPAGTVQFSGEELTDGRLNLGWVYRDTAPVYSSPGGRRIPGEVRTKFERVTILQTKKRAGRRWFRIANAKWVSDLAVRAPTPAPLPEPIQGNERWIDIDLGEQIVTAYEGERPVFATLVSTGKGRGRSVQATPRGVHRIWVKLRSSDMDNLENVEANRYYAIQDVPWVMYFKQGYGLHGTFWHSSFGNVRSHGCVNLAPLDAQWLFHWTSPRLPAGWSAALPSPHEQGTLVRVR